MEFKRWLFINILMMMTLLAFAPLDETGRGVFPTYKEYLDHLFIIWQELDSPEYIRLSVYMD